MIGARRSVRILERNFLAYRRAWLVFVSGFFEPVLLLLSIGVGVGELVGRIQVGSQLVEYKQFVAPAMLAYSAMNGAVFDATIMFFIKYKYQRAYDAVLSTPLTPHDLAVGETLWSVTRGAIYSIGFLVTMLAFGLVDSWWAALAVPVAVIIGFAFAGAGIACATYMRSFIDFDFVNLALVPMLLFSATFFPLSQYPVVLRVVVQCTPLYQGVVLERALILGDVEWTLLGHLVYLLAMGAIGVRIAAKRIVVLLQP